MKKLALAAAACSLFLMSGCMTAATGEEAASPTSGILMYVVVMLVFFGAMYFIAIRPQRKQEKQREMLATMQVGDTVLTTSGFYGVVIDITEDTVIVEFGSNKNCRIPMQKSAVVQLEHPSAPKAPEPVKPAAKDEGDQK